MIKILFFLVTILSLSSHAWAESAENYIAKGNQAIREHRYEEAARHYEEALKIDPKNPNAHLALGMTYAQIGQQEKALQHTKKASELAPSYATFYHLGLIYAVKKNPQKALEAFDKALGFSPGSYLAEYQKGMILVSEKRYGEAVDSFRRVIQSHPQFADAYVSLGGAYYQLGDKEAARKRVDELRKLNQEAKAAALESWFQEKEAAKTI